MRDYQETVKWLRGYGEAEREVTALEEELCRWRSMAEGLRSELSGMPSGTGDGDALPRAVARIVELQNEINERIDRLVELRRELEEVVDAIPCEPWRRVLRYRYLMCMSWEQVCERMHYSDRHVRRIHRDAILYLSGDYKMS